MSLCSFARWVADLWVGDETDAVMQSFAKNAGLYGERVGALHVVSADKEIADRVRSQLSVLQRSEISNPPSHGARLVRMRVWGAVAGADGVLGVADPERARAVRGMETGH